MESRRNGGAGHTSSSVLASTAAIAGKIRSRPRLSLLCAFKYGPAPLEQSCGVRSTACVATADHNGRAVRLPPRNWWAFGFSPLAVPAIWRRLCWLQCSPTNQAAPLRITNPFSPEVFGAFLCLGASSAPKPPVLLFVLHFCSQRAYVQPSWQPYWQHQ